MIKNIIKEIVGVSPKPNSSNKLQNILKSQPSSPAHSPPPKKKKVGDLARRFLDLEASQSSGASADDEDEDDDGRVSNLFASQENSLPSPGDYLAFNFELELREEFKAPLHLKPKAAVRPALKRTMSTPAKPQTTDTAKKVNLLREARNRRVSVSEPESPIMQKYRKSKNINVGCTRHLIPKKYRLSLESPFEDFRLVSPKTSKIKQPFTFVGDVDEQVKPLALPNPKPFPTLAYVKKK